MLFARDGNLNRHRSDYYLETTRTGVRVRKSILHTFTAGPGWLEGLSLGARPHKLSDAGLWSQPGHRKTSGLGFGLALEQDGGNRTTRASLQRE